ncbi:MAG: T9SS type A sorting domain-containing protein [candidate division Zixibacteria bacterium]|nr:T9SS type A sorting domain-containing protein [candidate division Zixibacteria bacterium]
MDGNSVCAKAKSLGVFRLIYDPRGKHMAGIPQRYELYQNYPNPFNPQTQLRYDLPASGQVELSVYNVLGQRVRVLVDEMQEAGRKSVIWDGKDGSGHEVASGIYFYKIKAENYQKTMKMVLLK